MSSEEKVIAGRYRLVEKLGSGGMGVVWRAHDERLRRTVAVKRVHVPAELTTPQGEEMVRRTMREGRIAARLHHPQLITVYDVVEDSGQPYLIMEYFPATSLADRGTLPYAEVARIGAEAAAALTAAHEAGVVHRDVKPANVLVGEDDTVKITDFGISRVVEDLTLTATSTFAGTPAYLAPEVAKGGDASFASDVYSLGATLYTAIEGTPPAGHDSNPMKMLFKAASGEITPPTKAGPLTDTLMWLLDADPAKRPTMAEARDALAALHETPEAAPPPVAVIPVVPAPTPTAVTPAAPPPPPAEPAKRRRNVALAAGLLAVAVVAALVTMLVNTGGTPEGNAAQPTRTTATNDEPTSEPSSDAPTTSPSPPPTTTTAEPTTTTAPNPPPAPPPPQTAATPLAAINEYYALMPGNRDQAWTRLTPKFQASPAGGRSGYESYWSGVRSISATDTVQTGENTVEVTLRYEYTSGRRVTERHQYFLVNQNGTWLIDTVRVLSST
ncbi:serine/threonine-protein kinase [Actinophytocola sp.]|uniref:serine/threonine-protein kinase n=1 Tax=Actinophytocola sp. TaxID=1872138 RepID=UPI002ED0B7F0